MDPILNTTWSSASSINCIRQEVLLGRIAAIDHEFANLDNPPSNVVPALHILHAKDLGMMSLCETFTQEPAALQQTLTEAFLEKCWIWNPIVEPAIIRSHPSVVLRHAVMLAGAAVSPGVMPRDTMETYYTRFKALVCCGSEKNTLLVLASICFLQWYTPLLPSGVSTDTARSWNAFGIGLAHQIGLHRAPRSPRPDDSMRRRIWFSLCMFDCIASAAHGSPRLIATQDPDLKPLCVSDFPIHEQTRAELFIAQVGVSEVMGSICESLTWNRLPDAEATYRTTTRLAHLLRGLPRRLRLASSGESLNPFDPHVGQLHITILSTIIITFRPPSPTRLRTQDVASVAAAILSLRIFKALEVRGLTADLDHTFAWHLLVTAMPLLACLSIPSVRDECNLELDVIEKCLHSLAALRPASATNLKKLRALRASLSRTDVKAHAMSAFETGSGSGEYLITFYGDDAVQLHRRISASLKSFRSQAMHQF